MGRRPRRKQQRLGKKLFQIRKRLHLSQNEILRRLGIDEKFTRTIISNYEQNHREPPLFVLLEYARLANVCLDVIVDDNLTLPKELPWTASHRGVNVSGGKVRTTKK